MQTEKCTKVLKARSLSALNTDERTPYEFPLCQREDDHIIKRLLEEFLAGQT